MAIEGDNSQARGSEKPEATELSLVHLSDSTRNAKGAEGARPTDLMSAQEERRLTESVNNSDFAHRNTARIDSVMRTGDQFVQSQLKAVLQDNFRNQA